MYKVLAELPTLIFENSSTLCAKRVAHRAMNTRDEQRLKKFGQHLRALREKKGLSIRELSNRCDVDYGKISKIENNKANLTLTTLFELAEGLEVHPSALLEFYK